MQPNSIFAIHTWRLPEILFVVAACFAIGASGFFLAVFLQLRSSGIPNGVYADAKDVPVADKVKQLEALSANSPQPNNANAPVGASQASEDDALAAQKLKLL